MAPRLGVNRGSRCGAGEGGARRRDHNWWRGRVPARFSSLPPLDPHSLPRPVRGAAVPVQAAAGPGSAGPLCGAGWRRRPPRGGAGGEGGAPGPPRRCRSPRPRPAWPAAAAWPRRGVSTAAATAATAATAAGRPARVFMSGRGVSQQHGGLPDQRRHRLRAGGWAHRAAALRQRRWPHLQVSAGEGDRGEGVGAPTRAPRFPQPGALHVHRCPLCDARVLRPRFE